MPFLISPNNDHLRNLASVNRAFFRYCLRVKKYQMHYSEIMRGKQLWKALHYACSFGDVRKVADLITRPTSGSPKFTPKKHIQHEDGTTCFLYAIHQGRDLIVRYLIKQCSRYNTIPTRDGVSPLHIAAQYSRYNIMRMLLETSYGPELKNLVTTITKETALFSAVIGESQGSINILLRYGADKTVVNYKNFTPEQLCRSLNLRLEVKKPSRDEFLKKKEKSF